MIRGHLKILVLKELKRDRMSGYAIMARLKSHIGIRPSPGSVYPLLDTLKDAGLVSIDREGRKKVYTLTKKGENYLADVSEKMEQFTENFSEGIKILEAICDNGVPPFFRSLAAQLKAGKIPLSGIDKELSEFRVHIAYFIENRDSAKIAEIRKILKETNKKLSVLVKNGKEKITD